MKESKTDYYIAPSSLFFCAMIVIPSFIFQTNLTLKFIITMEFILLYILKGKKFKPLPNIILTVSICLMNLFNPSGKVLVDLKILTITDTALFNGLDKSMLLIGLIYLSRFSISSDLYLPGHIGNLLSKTFYYFEKLTEIGIKKSKGSLISQIDELLFKLEITPKLNEKNYRRKSSAKGKVFIIIFITLNWVLFFSTQLSFSFLI